MNHLWVKKRDVRNWPLKRYPKHISLAFICLIYLFIFINNLDIIGFNCNFQTSDVATKCLQQHGFVWRHFGLLWYHAFVVATWVWSVRCTSDLVLGKCFNKCTVITSIINSSHSWPHTIKQLYLAHWYSTFISKKCTFESNLSKGSICANLNEIKYYDCIKEVQGRSWD